jgi:hypothetical protein
MSPVKWNFLRCQKKGGRNFMQSRDFMHICTDPRTCVRNCTCDMGRCDGRGDAAPLSISIIGVFQKRQGRTASFRQNDLQVSNRQCSSIDRQLQTKCGATKNVGRTQREDFESIDVAEKKHVRLSSPQSPEVCTAAK